MAQDVVAVRDIVDDHPESIEVQDFGKLLVLAVHLPVNAVDVLDPAVDGAFDAVFPQPLDDQLLHIVKERLVRVSPFPEALFNFLVANGIQI